MTKIDVQDDITTNFDDKVIYYRLIEILSGIKLVGGNIMLNKTIHNHPKVRDYLINMLKSDLMELEREILNLE